MAGEFLSACPYGDVGIRDGIWYHYYDFHKGVEGVAPEFDLKPHADDFLLPQDMKGRTFLDIGTASGFFSFEMERRGAEVVSFDLSPEIDTDQIPYPNSPNRREQNRNFIIGFHKAYWYAHKQFRSRARVVYGSVMAMPDWLGQYDVVVLGSILQHLRDPLGAIIQADRHARDTLIIAEAYYKSKEPVMRFQADPDWKEPQYWTWWVMSPAFLALALKTLGYGDIEVRGPFKLKHLRGNFTVPTVTVKGRKKTK